MTNAPSGGHGTRHMVMRWTTPVYNLSERYTTFVSVLELVPVVRYRIDQSQPDFGAQTLYKDIKAVLYGANQNPQYSTPDLGAYPATMKGDPS